MSKIIYVTTISDTINAFLIPHIEMLIQEGHTVDIACSIQKPLNSRLSDMGCNIFDLPFSRSPLSRGNIKAYRRITEIIKEQGYDVVHSHTPNASAIVRLACRKLRRDGLKVVYTAHGFHFYKGAPFLNWAAYYPVEKLCSNFTDLIVVINREDYKTAKCRLGAARVEFLPGVGIDLKRFASDKAEREMKRSELGVTPDKCLLLSVGELSRRKNHEVIIKAVAQMKNPNIIYAIAGEGALKEDLEQLSSELSITNQIKLLGYRVDTAELYQAADIFCHPSLQEGLPVAVMEAMACGLPCIGSEIRGTADLIDHDLGGYLIEKYDVKGYANSIQLIVSKKVDVSKLQQHNAEKIKQYSIDSINKQLLNIYRSL